jgi:hypothetical protein
MDLTIGSFNFCVGSLGSVRLSDPINLGPSAGKTASAAKSETSVGSSSEVDLPVSIKPTKNTGNTVDELNEIMENLDLEESSGYSDMVFNEKFDSSNNSVEDFTICYNTISGKYTNTWKTGAELHDNEQTIFTGSSSGINK